MSTGNNYSRLNSLAKAENMSVTIAYVDASRGVSGALLLSSLCAHGFSMIALQKTIAAVLPVLPDVSQVEVQEVCEQGIRGLCVTLLSYDTAAARPYGAWKISLQRSALPERVRTRALTCLERLTEAEALVTGQEQQTIVLAAATIIEVLSVVAGLDELGIAQLYVSTLPLASGLVETASGLQSVPSAVTLEILRRVRAPWQSSPLAEAGVTPVGAAILAVCARFEALTLIIDQVGYGFAADNGPRGPLRLCLGQSLPVEPLAETPPEQEADSDWVSVIESHLDTMTGELLGGLMERLFEAGALDVTYTPIQMKKNRPATLITIICPPALGEMFALLLLRETTTLGVRTQQIRRLKAQREQIELTTSLGPMLVKVKRLGTQIISAAPEYEECRRIAHEQNIPLIDVYEVARQSIQSAII